MAMGTAQRVGDLNFGSNSSREQEHPSRNPPSMRSNTRKWRACSFVEQAARQVLM